MDIVDKNIWRFLLTLSPTVPAAISTLAEDLFVTEDIGLDEAIIKVNNCLRNAQSNGWMLTRRNDTIKIDIDHYNMIVRYYNLTGRDTEVFSKLPYCTPGKLIAAIRSITSGL